MGVADPGEPSIDPDARGQLDRYRRAAAVSERPGAGSYPAPWPMMR